MKISAAPTSGLTGLSDIASTGLLSSLLTDGRANFAALLGADEMGDIQPRGGAAGNEVRPMQNFAGRSDAKDRGKRSVQAKSPEHRLGKALQPTGTSDAPVQERPVANVAIVQMESRVAIPTVSSPEVLKKGAGEDAPLEASRVNGMAGVDDADGANTAAKPKKNVEQEQGVLSKAESGDKTEEIVQAKTVPALPKEAGESIGSFDLKAAGLAAAAPPEATLVQHAASTKTNVELPKVGLPRGFIEAVDVDQSGPVQQPRSSEGLPEVRSVQAASPPIKAGASLFSLHEQGASDRAAGSVTMVQQGAVGVERFKGTTVEADANVSSGPQSTGAATVGAADGTQLGGGGASHRESTGGGTNAADLSRPAPDNKAATAATDLAQVLPARAALTPAIRQPSPPETGLATSRSAMQGVQEASSGRALESALRGDLRVGVQTEAFGRITIQTVAEGGQLSAQLSLENTKQSAVLAAHLPAVEQRLVQQHGLNASVSLAGGGSGGGMSGGERDSDRNGSQRYSGFANMRDQQATGISEVASGDVDGSANRRYGRSSTSGRLDIVA